LTSRRTQPADFHEFTGLCILSEAALNFLASCAATLDQAETTHATDGP
jgi:hypothetical protein